MAEIKTVDNTITPDQLGKTLMHEHLQTAFPGWEFDALLAPHDRREVAAKAVDRIADGHQSRFPSGFQTFPRNSWTRNRPIRVPVSIVVRMNSASNMIAK